MHGDDDGDDGDNDKYDGVGDVKNDDGDDDDDNGMFEKSSKVCDIFLQIFASLFVNVTFKD